MTLCQEKNRFFFTSNSLLIFQCVFETAPLFLGLIRLTCWIGNEAGWTWQIRSHLTPPPHHTHTYHHPHPRPHTHSLRAPLSRQGKARQGCCSLTDTSALVLCTRWLRGRQGQMAFHFLCFDRLILSSQHQYPSHAAALNRFPLANWKLKPTLLQRFCRLYLNSYLCCLRTPGSDQIHEANHIAIIWQPK